MRQALGQTSNIHPGRAGSKGQMPHPTTPYFLPPKRAKGQRGNKASPPPAARPQDVSRKHRLHLLSHSSNRKAKCGQVRGMKEGAGCLGAIGIWAGLAWPQTGKGDQANPPWGGFLYPMQESKV